MLHPIGQPMTRPIAAVDTAPGTPRDTPAEAALRSLIGRPGSRHRVPTPALLLDLEAAERNLMLMAARAREAGLALRPHAKSHKCAAIARLQLQHGAVGQCCAKLGEAEALVAAGIRGVLVTSPIAGADLAERAARLALVDPMLELVVDHPDQVRWLQAACRGLWGEPAPQQPRLGVLIDVDVGLGRTGVRDAADALALAGQIGGCDALRLQGVQGYGGHWQHLPGEAERHAAVAAGSAGLLAVVQALREAGHAVPRVTGGGTGSFGADADLGVLTEVQPGSYVFMDRQYREALDGDADGDFEQALWVQARVISIQAPDHVTVDAGLKALATDGPLPLPGPGRFAGCSYRFFGDEHGRLSRPTGKPGDEAVRPVQLDERVELVPPHCDPTVDRYRRLVLVRGDTVVDVVPLEAAQQSA